MAEPLRVLLVEDAEDDAALVLRELRRGGYEPHALRVETADDMRAALRSAAWDVVLADYRLPRFSAPAALALLREAGIDLPFVIVTGAISEDTAVAAMKAGAHDYVMKDNLRRLCPALQRELREAEERRRRAGFEGAARRADRLAALGTLAAGLAHELNNPIGIMSSRIELMLRDAEASGLPPAVADDLRVIHRHALRVARIAQGLLSFARPGTGERTRVDLNQVVQDTLLLAGKQISKDGVTVRTALAPVLPLILADASALEQVLLNLLVNARDAIEGHGVITIETSASPGPPPTVRVAVSDTGRGIAAADGERIFDPFFTTKADGTGLGLAIGHAIVREHGGAIEVASRSGEGARFTVSLPALPD